MSAYKKRETALKNAGELRFNLQEFDNFRNDKEIVLKAVKKNKISIFFASKEIQELCKDKDPIPTLEKAIAYDKLKTQLKPKADEKPAQKLKI